MLGCLQASERFIGASRPILTSLGPWWNERQRESRQTGFALRFRPWKSGAMSKIFLVVMAALTFPAGTAPKAQGRPGGPSVGVVGEPCAALPRRPATSNSGEIDQWQKNLQLADFFGLCRYRSENERLSAATPRRTILIGDSITEGWKESRPKFFGVDRIDRGIGGQTSSQMLGRFYADVIALHPATVHILAGTNDIAGNTGPTTLENIENNIKAMVELARAHRIRVVLGTVIPAARYWWRPEIDPVPQITALNSWIRGYARENRLGLVDYYAVLDDGQHGLRKIDSDDGVHPSAEGYKKMERAFNTEVARLRFETRQ